MRNRIVNASIDEIGEYVRAIQPAGKVAIISDTNVYNLYFDRCRQNLMAAGFQVIGHSFHAGEKNKNMDTYMDILEFLASMRFSRSDSIIALGGGVTGDVAGFAAATYMRGIKLFQVPTSLLAMVDSSIGGKTGINLKMGKNLAGAFYLPEMVLCDVDFLRTLPYRELHNGHAELIKMGIIAGGDFFYEASTDIEHKDETELSSLVYRSAELKKQISQDDFLDLGKRHVLNLGHTVGHAIEKLSGYRINHGAAVAKGISVITDISELLNYCSAETKIKIKRTLQNCKFDLNIGFTSKEILDVVKNDKKVKDDQISIVLIKGIGDCDVIDISIKEFNKVLDRALEGKNE